MESLTNSVKKILKEEEGVTAIEYGLIASLIALAIIAAVTLTGGKLASTFGFITTSLKDS